MVMGWSRRALAFSPQWKLEVQLEQRNQDLNRDLHGQKTEGKYNGRNDSFFLGSVKSAKRFARLISLVQSAKNCKRNVQKYFHDNLNRVMVTAKEELVNCLPHKWVEPVTIPLVY